MHVECVETVVRSFKYVINIIQVNETVRGKWYLTENPSASHTNTRTELQTYSLAVRCIGRHECNSMVLIFLNLLK